MVDGRLQDLLIDPGEAAGFAPRRDSARRGGPADEGAGRGVRATCPRASRAFCAKPAGWRRASGPGAGRGRGRTGQGAAGDDAAAVQEPATRSSPLTRPATTSRAASATRTRVRGLAALAAAAMAGSDRRADPAVGLRRRPRPRRSPPTSRRCARWPKRCWPICTASRNCWSMRPAPHEEAWRDWAEPAPDEVDDGDGAMARARRRRRRSQRCASPRVRAAGRCAIWRSSRPARWSPSM